VSFQSESRNAHSLLASRVDACSPTFEDQSSIEDGVRKFCRADRGDSAHREDENQLLTAYMSSTLLSAFFCLAERLILLGSPKQGCRFEPCRMQHTQRERFNFYTKHSNKQQNPGCILTPSSLFVFMLAPLAKVASSFSSSLLPPRTR
jgi:hypothetical protein